MAALSTDRVWECTTAEEAIAAAPMFRPHCVTLDFCLPGMDGIRAVQVLRVSNPEAQIFVVSAFNQPELQRAAAAAGAHRYFHKEDLTELGGAVRALAAKGPPSAGAAAATD